MIRRLTLLGPSVVLLSLIAALPVLARYGRSSRVYGNAGVFDAPNVEKRIVGTAAEAYASWKGHGFRGRTAVFVADSWARLDIDETPAIPMSRPYPLKPYDIARSFESYPVSQANLIFIASLNGIVRSVVAVLSREAYNDRLAGLGNSRGNSPAPGTVFLPHQGFPRWFTTPAGLRGCDEPVLLYVGASVFRSIEPEELFRDLKGAGVRSDSVLLCLMAGDPAVTDGERDKLVRFARLAGVPVTDERAATHPSASGKSE